MSSSGMSSSEHIKKTAAQATGSEGGLPESYGETEAFLLPRDPHWMFIGWEITQNSINRVKADLGEDIFDKSRSVIRVYDVSDVKEFDGSNATKYFDVPAVLEARRWYINVSEAGRAYCCEVGIVLPDGRFISLVRTNTVGVPTGRISDVEDEKWMSVSGDFEKLLQLSGVEYIGKGSGEVAKILAQRWEMLKSVFSRSASWGGSSALMEGRKSELDRRFWLVADCELILYGATVPDAKVTVAGRTVKLNQDGTFVMRFAFPDGTLDLPVHATSSDDVDHREIRITANRRTDNNGNR